MIRFNDLSTPLKIVVVFGWIALCFEALILLFSFLMGFLGL